MRNSEICILLVDDSSGDRELVLRNLRKSALYEYYSQVDITEAPTMAAAMEALANVVFDCVMLDLGLPDGHGIENIRRIRSVLPDTPILVLTGLKDESTKRSALTEGATVYIDKGYVLYKKDIASSIIEAIENPKNDVLAAGVEFKQSRVPDSIDDLTINSRGEILNLEPNLLAVLGYTVSEVVGQPIENIIWPANLPDMVLMHKQLGNHVAIPPMELALRAKSGERYDFIVSARLIDQGVGYGWTIENITLNKLREKAQHQLAAIFESTLDAILTCDLEGVVTSCNPAASEMFGYHADELLAMPYELLLPAGRRGEEVATFRRAARSGKAISGYRTVRLRKDQSEINVSITASPLRDTHGGLVGTSKVIRDIEHEVRAEQELMDANTLLREKMKELEAAQIQLVESEKLASLGQKLSELTHEVATPLGVVNLSISSLHDDLNVALAKSSSKEAQTTDLNKFAKGALENTSMALDNIQRASAIIESYKTISVDQASQRVRLFNVYEYIETLLLSLAPRLRTGSHRVEFDCPKGLMIESFPGGFSQVISNLILNSCEHAWREKPGGGLASIVVVPLADQRLEICYSDDGCGVQPDKLEKIWEPYYTTAKDRGGSGVGLAVVKAEIEKLQGNIVAYSVLGKGLKFEINIPTKLAL